MFVYLFIRFFTPKLQPDTLPNKINNCSQATTKYQRWMHEDQIAGFYQEFGNITFLTIKVTSSVLFSFLP